MQNCATFGKAIKHLVAKQKHHHCTTPRKVNHQSHRQVATPISLNILKALSDLTMTGINAPFFDRNEGNQTNKVRSQTLGLDM